MNPDGEVRGVGMVGRAIAVAPFAGVAALLTYVLVYMMAGSDSPPYWETFDTPEELAVPIAMGLVTAFVALVAIVVPRLALKTVKRRFAGSGGLELYVTILVLVTSLLSIGALMAGFTGAFLLESLVYWAVAVLVATLPIVSVWPTRKRRERLAADWNRMDNTGA